MDYIKLAELLYPDVVHDVDYYEELYPPRRLPEGAKVTRMAPSPTGFVHFGSMFPTMVCEMLAHQSGGTFYLRIEDTDSKREVEGAEEDIIESYKYFGIKFDECPPLGGKYAPYRQSERKEIYHTFAKKLVAEGKAYPCFCTAEELDAIRTEQENEKLNMGYYGKYAKCRSLTYEEIEEKINNGVPYVLRFKSFGNLENKIKFTDLVKGVVELTENDIDHVMLKSDGVPTYHFAHAVDDHLMRTTHVVRGEEWLPSLPYHIQLFNALGFNLPKYLHISQLMKLENGAKKKLSKRDAGTGLNYYISEGYPPNSVVEYVLTLLNSNFEEWRNANKTADARDFKFSIKKMSPSGCLFDLVKLNDISKNVISQMTAEQVYNGITQWAKNNDAEFYELLSQRPEYAKEILSIGRGGAKARKDFAKWSETKDYMGFFYNEYFEIKDTPTGDFDASDIVNTMKLFTECYSDKDEQNVWFDKIKGIAAQLGFSPDIKAYKLAPDSYKGHVGDISMFLRLAVTGKLNSPDMYSVMKVLGQEETITRIKKYMLRYEG